MKCGASLLEITKTQKGNVWLAAMLLYVESAASPQNLINLRQCKRELKKEDYIYTSEYFTLDYSTRLSI